MNSNTYHYHSLWILTKQYHYVVSIKQHRIAWQADFRFPRRKWLTACFGLIHRRALSPTTHERYKKLLDVAFIRPYKSVPSTPNMNDTISENDFMFTSYIPGACIIMLRLTMIHTVNETLWYNAEIFIDINTPTQTIQTQLSRAFLSWTLAYFNHIL